MIKQTIFYDHPTRKGNCLAAAVAAYFDLPLEAVPHFIELDDDEQGERWWYALVGFMAARGLACHRLDSLDEVEPGEVAFVAGPSPRGVMHQVLYRDGELWHDPHPSDDGVLGVQCIEVWRPATWDHEA